MDAVLQVVSTLNLKKSNRILLTKLLLFDQYTIVTALTLLEFYICLESSALNDHNDNTIL